MGQQSEKRRRSQQAKGAASVWDGTDGFDLPRDDWQMLALLLYLS